jgi:hypothetical protein
MITFPKLAPNQRLAMLEPPRGPVNMVLDTDTYNEIDDQFALVYALLSPNLNVEAFYAAPYFNSRSSGPADGMEKSYEEILRLLGHLGVDPADKVWRGSTRYLPSPEEAVYSPAAADLIQKALAPRTTPLYVLAIGAITNVAAAILMRPEIIKHIVVVWLGGQPTSWPTAREFNLQQDVAAAQVVFDCGVPLVHVPCKNVAEHLRTTLPEMATYVKGRGAIGDYLYQIYEEYSSDHYARSKVIWDISTVAYLNNPSWLPSELHRAPLLRDDITWGVPPETRHMMRTVTDIRRDAVFADLFRKLQARAEGK